MSRTSAASLSPAELAAWRGMLEVHSAMISQLDAELVREHDLPLTAYEVLISLDAAEAQRLRMGELADRLLLSRSGITRLVDRLESLGLVERQRCDDDGRGYFAVLTKDGRRRLAGARPTHLAGVRRHFLSRLRDDDLEALAAAWRRLGVETGREALDEAA